MKVTKNKRVGALTALLCAYSAGFEMPAEARGEHNDRPRGLGRINLDLNSTDATVNFSRRLAETVSIRVGDQMQTINAGQMLTPAEAIAAYQVMRGQEQSIILGADGNAVGGNFQISTTLQKHVRDISIPANVTVINDIARNGTLRLNGDLNNAGNFYAVSTDQNLDTARVIAQNIFNNATISTVIPEGGLAGVSNANQNLNLSLTALNDVVNAGTITSSGNLEVVAGRSIINSTAQGLAGTAVMQAANNVNLTAANLVNAETIAAQVGNINLAGQVAADAANGFNQLSIDARGGQFQALNGAINIGSALSSMNSGSAGTDSNVNAVGGDWFSKELNITAGGGEITASLGKVTGTLNSSSAVAHINADTDVLTIGNNCVTGDPTFANTGDIIINGDVTVNEALAIIAGGDILVNGAGSITNNSAAATYLVAGAHITSGGTAGDGTLPPGSAAVGSVTFNFDNTAGGNIDFTETAIGPVVTTNGGSLTLLANSNGAGTGNVWTRLNAGSIVTDGSTSGGSVTIVAGGAGGTTALGETITDAVRIYEINTSSSDGNGGSVSIKTAAPTITSGPSATFLVNGTTAATFGSGAVSAGGVNVVSRIQTSGADGTDAVVEGAAGDNGKNAGAVSIVSGGALSVDTIEAQGGRGGAGGDSALGTGGAGGNGGLGAAVSLTAQTLLTVNQTYVSGGNGGIGGEAVNGVAGGAGGSGGAAGSVLFNSIAGGFTGTTIEAVGGNGSNGGNSNGNQGNGGSGAAGGTVIMDTSTYLAFGGYISTSGGSGGSGTGIGASGTGGAGAASGDIELTTVSGDIGSSAVASGDIFAYGGSGGDGTAGGTGASAGTVTITSGGGVFVGSLSASGGSASTASTAGQGGDIIITAVADIGTSSAPLGLTSVDGGAGQGSSGSNGADAGSITINGSANVYLGFLNASGGFSNSDVIGGDGGSISATADGALQFFAATANGGDGGSNSAWGGNGGNITLTGSTINNTTIVSGIAARGGNAGTSPDGAGGNGGNGGGVSINSTDQTAIFLIDTRGGSGGAGASASGATSSGYNGGLGGLGGQVLINAGSLVLDSINTSGGSGGAGGSGNFSTGGSGGDGGQGGASGIITLTVTNEIEIDTVIARGGAGGTGGISGVSLGSGGAGGSGGGASNVGITGGTIELGTVLMIGGNGGTGGSGTTTGTNGALGGAAGNAGDLTISSTSLLISFGSLNGGVGGAGGASGDPDSSGGNGGIGGSGGVYDLTTTGNIEFGDVRADGGNGGSGGRSGFNSGGAGTGGSGGAAGSFDLTTAVLTYDYISAIGGNGGTGGSAGGLNSAAGGTGGNGTNGGTVLVTGSISPGVSSAIALNGGTGGAGGFAGNGSPGTPGLNGQFGSITAEGAFLGTDNYIETNAGTITMRGANGVFVRATNPNVLISGLNSGDTYRVESPFGSITVADVPVTSDLRLIANNTINFSGTSTVSVLNVVPGAGGTLVLNAQNYTWLNQGAAPLVLQANGTASGGFIDFTQVANDINVGTAAGQVQFEAQGGNGGALSVFAINGNINLADIANGIQVSPTGVNGSGASLTLTAGNLIYGGALPLTFNQANGNGTGNGGDITIDLRNVSTDITLGSSGQYILEATGGNGGSVGFLTNGNLIVAADGFNVAPTSANGNVGSVGFTGALVQGESGGKLVLDLSAGPASTGNAGNIFVRQTAATGTTIGTGASDNFQFAATAAIGNGGSISFITSGDLTVDPAALSTLSFNKKGGNSGSIFLRAGDDVSTGVLIINGDLSTASKKGTAGNITLESDSTIPFNYGGSAFSGNGFNGGSASVSGSTNGSLAIVNSGDVNINESITAAKQIALTSDSGALNINASLGGKDTNLISLSGNQVLTGSTKVKYTGGTLAVSSSDDFNGPGGAAIQTSIQNLTLSVAGDASISNKLALAINTSTVGGSLTIASKGAIETANQSDIVTAVTLTLSTKKTVGFDHAFGISALQLSLQGLKGNLNIHSTRAVELLDSSFGGSLVFDSDDSINVSGAFGSSKAAITLQANFGSIATQGNGVIIADSATLHADSTNAALGSAGSINALKLDASTVNATADRLINIFDVASSVTVERAETQNGNLTIAAGPDSKALVVPGVVVARNGAVDLQNQNATKGTIKIASGADISTQGGGGGAVSIFIGAAPPAMVAGTAPAGVTINQLGVVPGDVLFGTNGITANTKNGDNVLNLKNANIIFSTGGLSAKAIVLDGNTTILADPPNPEGFVPMSFAAPNFATQSVAAPSDSGIALNSGSPLMLSSTGSEQALPNSISSLALPSTVSSLVLSNTVSPLGLSSTVGGSTALGAPINIIETSSFANSVTKSSLMTNQASSSEQPSAAHLSMAMAAIAGGGVGFEPGAFDALVLADHDRSLAGQFNTAAQITDRETTPNGTKRLTLHRGSLVVAQNVATSVETEYGTVSIDAKSVVLLMATGNSLAVYNVDDHRKGAVKVENGNRTIMLSPGNHAVLTSAKVSSFDAINPAECFAYRNLNFAESANGLKTFTGEFSIPAALHAVRPLKHLVKTHCDSADASKESRAIVDHLMKTTAVLLHMQGAGRFEQYVRPRVAAYAPLTSN